MRNISLRKIVNIFLFPIYLLGFLIIVGFPIYIGLLWHSHNYAPDFLKVDSCLDRGGAWHYVAKQCVYTDSEEAELIEKFGPFRPEK